MINNELKTIQSEMRKLLLEAYRGWRIWHNLVKKYELKKPEKRQTAVILMPRNDLENSYYALLYLDRFLNIHNYQSAVLLINAPILEKAAAVLCNHVRGIEYLSDEDICALLQYYVTCPFDPRFIAASLTEPNGRNGKLLNGTNHITTEEMVAIGVYQIIPFVSKKRPIYAGNDEELAQFMQLGGSYRKIRTTDKIR